MTRITFIFITAVLFISCGSTTTETTKSEKPPTNAYRLDKSKIEEALTFTKASHYNEDVAFLIDMGIRSGRKRFFVVDLKNKKTISSGLVTHGHCQEYGATRPKFSNESGSNCSSLGKYRIGAKYNGQFGTAYKLYGLEESNSNAFDRFVVLHAHSCVPDEESIVGICRSEGCPTVSPQFLQTLEPILDQSDLPTLLWIFND